MKEKQKIYHEQPTAVDTGLSSKDDRLGPDGKISEKQGEYLKAKAINNISESLVQRATKLGSSDTIMEDGNVAHFHINDEDPPHVTGLVTARVDSETGRDRHTDTTIYTSDRRVEGATSLKLTTHFGKQHQHVHVPHIAKSGELNGKTTASAFNETNDELRSKDSKQAAKIAIEIIREQQGVLAAAKRVNDAKDDQPDQVA